MIQMSPYPSRFYKADQRIAKTTEQGTNLSSIAHPFGKLKFLNDIFLLAGQEIIVHKENSSCQILLPVSGVLSYSGANFKDKLLASEEVLITGEKEYCIKNPFETTVNYLQISLEPDTTSSVASLPDQPITLSVPLKEFNNLTSLHLDKIDPACFAGIAVYKGRTKASYTLKNPGNGIFAYVINGAFELQERLMEHRDGLALWDVKQIEFEALSEFAILLLLEIPV